MIGEQDVERVVGRIVALYDPTEVWVFGSYAKGTMTEGSDLDLVVVKATELPRHLRGRNVVSVLKGTSPFGLDVLFLTPEEVADELRQPYSLLSTVLPTAKRVHPRQR